MKLHKKLLTILLGLCLLVSASIIAYAASYSGDGVFPGLSGILPGDSLTLPENTGWANLTANWGVRVNFIDWDEKVLKTDLVPVSDTESGSSSAPEDPTRPGYRFIGWERYDTNDGPATLNADGSVTGVNGPGPIVFIAVYENVLPAIDVRKESDLAAGETAALGQTITYTVTVTNVGDVAVENIKVEDELAGAKLADGESDTIASLLPGGSAEVHFTYVVTEQDILSGNIKNTASASGTDPNGDPAEKFGECEDITDPVHTEISAAKKSDVEGKAKLGQTITYTVTVTNVGNVTISDLTVEDALSAAKLADGETGKIASLAPGKSADVRFTYVVTVQDILNGSIKNTASASGTDPNGDPAEDEGTVEDPTEPIPGSIKVTKVSDLAAGETAALGQTITYTVTVTNTGILTVTDITVEDALPGAKPADGESNVIASLEPGKSAEVHFTYVVTEQDILNGSILNTATASGTDPNGDSAEDDCTVEDPTEPIPGSIKVTKVSDLAAGESFVLGQTITYTVTVTNTGIMAVTNITVEDTLPGAELADGESNMIASLAPGESAEVHFTYAVTEADILAGSIKNTAAVSGDDLFGDPVFVKAETENPAAPMDSKIEVTKVSDLAAGETAALGQTITYTVTVTNAGNVTIRDITVEDKLPGAELAAGESNVIASLAPGESAEVHFTYVVTEQDILNGSIRNTAAVSGTDPNGDPAENEADCEDPTDIPTGSLTVSKTVSGNDADSEKAFDFTVTLDDTSVNGIYGGMTFRNGVAVFSLKGGESMTAESLPAGTNYTVTEADTSSDGYVTTKSGDTGSIEYNKAAKASFTGTKNSAPATGEDDRPALWLGLMLLSSLGLAGAFLGGNKGCRKGAHSGNK